MVWTARAPGIDLPQRGRLRTWTSHGLRLSTWTSSSSANVVLWKSSHVRWIFHTPRGTTASGVVLSHPGDRAPAQAIALRPTEAADEAQLGDDLRHAVGATGRGC